MLKWFNTYGKKLMVGVMVILMVAFLVPQGVSLFQPNPAKMPVGTADGRELIANDLNRAAFTVDLLKRMQQPPFGNDTEEEALRWALAQHDAQENLGLDAGAAEVNGVLAAGIEGWGESQEQNQRLAMDNFNIPAGSLQSIFREYLIFNKYRQLLLAIPNAPEEYAQTQRFFFEQRRPASIERLSNPALERMIVNNGTPATGRVLTIDASRYLDQTETPSEARLLEVFNEYKEDLADANGRFGYRYPDRVKLELLTFPLMVALDQAGAPKATEITEFFAANQTQFEGKTEYEARPQIIEILKRQKAAELARDASNRARDLLTRALNADDLEEQTDGTLMVPDDYVPMPLAEVVTQIESEFGFKPEASSPALASSWTPLREISLDPGLAGIFFLPRPDQPYTLGQYLASAKTFQTGDTPHPLAQLGLQVGVPSRMLLKMNPMRQPDAFVIARLVDAEADRVPGVMTDDLRPQVLADAKRLAAFDLLQAEADTWVTKAADGLDAVAVETDTTSQPFTGPRREVTPMATELLPPAIPGIGRSETFIDAVFTALGPENTTPAQGSSLLDDQQILALFEVSSVEGMTESRYSSEATNPIQVVLLGSAVSGRFDTDTVNPLSLEAIQQRVNWVPAREEQIEEEANLEDEAAEAA